MYVVTNRQINASKPGLKAFSKSQNEFGIEELRLVKVTREEDGGYQTELLDDELTSEEVDALVKEYDLDPEIGHLAQVDPSDPKYFASFRVACELFTKAQESDGKSILFYVHGFNNSTERVLEVAHNMQESYDVIVVPFCWPAFSDDAKLRKIRKVYHTDKEIARKSESALNRFIHKISDYYRMLTARTVRQISKRLRDHQDAEEIGLNDTERAARIRERYCNVKLSIMYHSMGNYLLKHATTSTTAGSRKSLFENHILVASDTNADDHEDWVERLHPLNKVYVVINRKDGILRWSEKERGEEQKARLGKSTNFIEARNAIYLDVTELPDVEDSHGYHHDPEIIRDGSPLKAVIKAAVRGEDAEYLMRRSGSSRLYT